MTTSTYRIRIHFSKEGDARFLGHRDMVRVWERWLRRVAAPLQVSHGFHPHPLMTFSAALPVGIAGTHEWLDVSLREPVLPYAFQLELQQHAPPGWRVGDVQLLPSHHSRRQARAAEYAIEIPPTARAHVQARTQELLASEKLLFRRTDNGKLRDIRPAIQRLQLDARGFLLMTLGLEPSASVRPRDVLQLLGLADLEHHGQQLVRTRVVEDSTIDPTTRPRRPAAPVQNDCCQNK